MNNKEVKGEKKNRSKCKSKRVALKHVSMNYKDIRAKKRRLTGLCVQRLFLF
jgi:hypothetical protein